MLLQSHVLGGNCEVSSWKKRGCHLPEIHPGHGRKREQGWAQKSSVWDVPKFLLGCSQVPHGGGNKGKFQVPNHPMALMWDAQSFPAILGICQIVEEKSTEDY